MASQSLKSKAASAAERMGEEIATLAARIDAATYELLVLIRKFDELGNWGCGFLSCAHVLHWRIGLAPGAARERVRIARALGYLPRISAAMKRGELSYSKVRALTRAARLDTEQDLLDFARAGTAAHVDENGMVVIRGRLAPEAGEVLRKAIEAASEKLYAREQKDRPSAGKLRADALVLVAESALRGGLDPGSSGDRYQVVAHVNEEELGTAASGSTNGRPRADRLAGDEAKALHCHGHVSAGTAARPVAPEVTEAKAPQNQAARPATAPDRNGHVPAGTPAKPVATEGTEAKAPQNQAARPATVPASHGHVPAGTPEKDVPAGTPARPVAPEVTEAKASQNQAARPATAPDRHGHVPSGNAGEGRSSGNADRTGSTGGARAGPRDAAPIAGVNPCDRRRIAAAGSGARRGNSRASSINTDRESVRRGRTAGSRAAGTHPCLDRRLQHACFSRNSAAHRVRRRQGPDDPRLGPDSQRGPQDPHHSTAHPAGLGVSRSGLPLPRLHLDALRRPPHRPLGRRRRNEALEPRSPLPTAPPTAS